MDNTQWYVAIDVAIWLWSNIIYACETTFRKAVRVVRIQA